MSYFLLPGFPAPVYGNRIGGDKAEIQKSLKSSYYLFAIKKPEFYFIENSGFITYELSATLAPLNIS